METLTRLSNAQEAMRQVYADHYQMLVSSSPVRDAYYSLLNVSNPTPEQLQAWKEEILRREKEVREARERAKGLLASCLSPEQQDQLQIYGHFLVVGSESKRSYHIYQGRTQNVRYWEMRDMLNLRHVYCLAMEDPEIPDEDVMLAQKLLIEADELTFLDLANHWVM